MLVRKAILLLLCFLSIAGCTSTPELTPYAREVWKAHPTVQDEFKDATVVLVGDVEESRIMMDKNNFIVGIFYTIRVVELFKGTAPEIIKLYSENSSGRFPMEIGIAYLIFASQQSFEGIAKPQLAVNTCGNSTTLRKSTEILLAVRKLKKDKPNELVHLMLPPPRG